MGSNYEMTSDKYCKVRVNIQRRYSQATKLKFLYDSFESAYKVA